MPTLIIDVPVRFANAEGDGDQQPKPTSKKTGRPTKSAITTIAQSTFFFTEGLDQGSCDAFGAARLGHHLAQHRAEADDQRDVTQGPADAALEGLDDLAERIPTAMPRPTDTIPA